MAHAKILLIFLAVTFAATALADDTPVNMPTTPAATKETWNGMTPEAQQAMKNQAKEEAQAHKSQWQQMSQEDKQAKRSTMRENAIERMGSMRATQGTRSFGRR